MRELYEEGPPEAIGVYNPRKGTRFEWQIPGPRDFNLIIKKSDGWKWQIVNPDNEIVFTSNGKFKNMKDAHSNGKKLLTLIEVMLHPDYK